MESKHILPNSLTRSSNHIEFKKKIDFHHLPNNQNKQ